MDTCQRFCSSRRALLRTETIFLSRDHWTDGKLHDKGETKSSFEFESSEHLAYESDLISSNLKRTIDLPAPPQARSWAKGLGHVIFMVYF